jgi:signal transduction histidine kinase
MYEVMSRYATNHYQSGLSQMEVLYETEKKEAQIVALDKERSLYRWLLVAAIIAIAALVIGCGLLVVVHKRKKALLAAKVALETETKERRILAQDLHDGLGGMLSLLRLKIESKDNKALSLLDNTIEELRRTAHHLMPEELLKNGLTSALNDFAISVPSAQFQANGQISLKKEHELMLYRCAYELVNNAIKHAQAQHISIQLMQEDQQVILTVSDDGRGMTEGHDGMGLQNIRERIAPYHGTINIASVEGKGTDINITLPL